MYGMQEILTKNMGVVVAVRYSSTGSGMGQIFDFGAPESLRLNRVRSVILRYSA